MNNQSTFWTLAAVLSVLLLASVSLSRIDSASVRRPFSSANWPGRAVTDKVTAFDDLAVQGLVDGEGTPEIKLVSNDTSIISKKSTSDTRFNLENLSRAGFNSPVIETLPFDGKMFDFFPLGDLISEVPSNLKISERVNAFNIEAFHVYAFSNLSKEMADEIFSLLKNNLSTQIDLVINQTNSFGLASFFINFTPPRENAFLVVKFEDSVYALTYPKSGGITTLDFYQLLQKIL